MLTFIQRYNGFVEVEGCHQLDFLFDGYFEALARHHDIESLEDFDPDIDAMPPRARPSKPASQMVKPEQKLQSPEQQLIASDQTPLSSAEAERKKTKNKKRNQRKRAAEKIKAKDAFAAVSESDDSKSKAELETSMALVKISPSAAASVEYPRVKFIPQPKDKVWMDHGCIKSEGCTKYFEILREAMLKVPIGNLGRRVYGPQP